MINNDEMHKLLESDKTEKKTFLSSLFQFFSEKKKIEEPDFSQQLRDSYMAFEVKEGFTERFVAKAEDGDYQGVVLENDPDKLKEEVLYLYIVTLDGQIWFAPQFQKGVKLTHGGLARKALAVEDGKTPAVLAAGTVLKTQEKKENLKEQKNLFFNLASGHFEPEVIGYTSVLEALAETLADDYSLFIQVGYAHTHYKSMDYRYCEPVILQNVMENKTLKLNLLQYIHTHDSEHPGVKVASKIFSSMNVAGKEYEEEPAPLSEKELQTLFNDHELADLIRDKLQFCPDEVQEYYKQQSSASSLSFSG
ncbi:hypothetical protein E3983_01230 [Legionella israelensis]|uniref:SseB protein N-terminal domain-containing protein n=1 Tax=Legionella israelensis TaxID=454 RepID=A0AAX1EDC2_9GAMM|nr:hypothetical protein [Legionella israelensis]QBR83098.1 hypothetical protein E3983_01230 [Legionella israelensis]